MLLPYTFAAFAFTSVLAAPASQSSSSPHLNRRQNPLTIGLGAAGVHENHDNTHRIQTMQAQIQAAQNQLNQLQAQEQTLRGAPVLVRRIIGTVLGAVGIHDSKKNRGQIQQMQQQVDSMRGQTDSLLQAEGLAPQLTRRQLGIILGPVAIHKAHTDANSLNQLQAELNGVIADLGRIQAAQQTRMQGMAMSGPSQVFSTSIQNFNGGAPFNGDVDAANEANYPPTNYGNGYGSNNGALPSSQGYNSPPVSYGGALPSSQGYNN
jgi:uncharacterized protein YhaN